MRKNYFYTVLREEFSLLTQALRSEDPSEIAECERIASVRYEAFTRRLFREFITPIDRVDLYEIASAVISVFPSVYGVLTCPVSERNRLVEASEWLATDSLEFGEKILNRYAAFRALRTATSYTPPVEMCFRNMDRIFRAMTLAALRNC